MRNIIIATAFLIAAGPVVAQTSTPGLVPNLDHYSLPPSGSQPSLIASPTPTPTPTPTPDVTPPPVTATVPAATPTSVPTPVLRPVPRATPTAVSEPRLPPSTTEPIGSPTPTPIPTPVLPTAVVVPERRVTPWPWIGLAALLLVFGVVWALAGRRKPLTKPDESAPEIAAPVPVPTERSPVSARVTAGDRPWLEFTFHPKRAGTNLLGAAVDYQLTVANPGTATARDIRVACELLGASRTQDAEIVALYDDTIDLPVAPPFVLAPGEVRVIDGFATRPRDRLEGIEVRGRPMFVPIVAVRARYAYDADSAGLATTSYVVGIERTGGARMAPIWLDQPPRMRSDVGARPYVAGKAGVERIGTTEKV